MNASPNPYTTPRAYAAMVLASLTVVALPNIVAAVTA